MNGLLRVSAAILLIFAPCFFTANGQPGDPGVPAQGHLLIFFAEGVNRPSDDSLASDLQGFSRQGWTMSVNRSDGTFTPYSSAERLIDELRSDSRKTDKGGNAAFLKALEELQSFAGRKALVEVTQNEDRSWLAWASQAVKADVPVYLVDGGRQATKCYSLSSGRTAGGQELGGCDLVRARARFVQDGVAHELKLSKALANVLKDGKRKARDAGRAN
jgi:hypothetical protein